MSEHPPYKAVLQYIDQYWENAIAANYKSAKWSLISAGMKLGYIRLQHPTISPNDDYFAHTQFYWDTYFTVLGLVVANRQQEALQMVDNLGYLYRKFKLIPARNSWTSIGRSQPPYLTRMAFEIYESGAADLKWLSQIMNIAHDEYENTWLSGQRFEVESGLSKYAPRFWKRHLTVYESGWDSSARYTSKNADSVIPVDLNCQLFMYESDFMEYARLIGNKEDEQRWHAAMSKRRKLIEEYFWDDASGFYYDFDNKTGRRTPLKTLAGYYPLWCGAASVDHAERAREQLKSFEYEGGLANTEKVTWRHQQWDYPNGWPPHQYIIFRSLKRYGFSEDANRIALKWLDLNAEIFERTNTLWEKYDVVRRDVGLRGRYPTQSGFAWTNAIFLRLTHELDEKF